MTASVATAWSIGFRGMNEPLLGDARHSGGRKYSSVGNSIEGSFEPENAAQLKLVNNIPKTRVTKLRVIKEFE